MSRRKFAPRTTLRQEVRQLCEEVRELRLALIGAHARETELLRLVNQLAQDTHRLAEVARRGQRGSDLLNTQIAALMRMHGEAITALPGRVATAVIAALPD